MKTIKQRKKSEAGFIIADFLFSFVLVIGIGIFIFVLTFSLATIEISQYIVWSASRTYASANVDEPKAKIAAQLKFKNLSEQFPKLTGAGEPSPWFKLDDFKAQDHQQETNFVKYVADSSDRLNRDGNLERRQPWTGASATIYLKLFSTMKIPFFGPVTDNPDSPDSPFKFRVYSFIIRNPSFKECSDFYKSRFSNGIQQLDSFSSLGVESSDYMVEDNGC